MIEKIPYLQSLGRHRGRAAAGLRLRRDRRCCARPTARAAQLLGLRARRALRPALAATASTPRRRAATLDEFRDMVKALHRAGIEVILDVVFNHTGEGNQNGPTLSFRGWTTRPTTTWSTHDGSYYTDYSGCGNTLNANHPVVRKMIVDCLGTGSREMHVDGFRFDLASILSRDPDGGADGEPAGAVEHRADPRPGRHQADRRGVGRRRACTRSGSFPGRSLGGVERPVPRRRPPIRPRRRRARSAPSPTGSPAAPTSIGHEGERRATASTSSPATTGSRSTTWSATTTSTTRPTARTTATAPTTT